MTAIAIGTAEPAVSPDLNSLPIRVDRKTGADLVTQRFFPIATRTLESWPLDWVYVNNKAVCQTSQLFAVAQEKLDAAARRQAA